MKSAHAVGGVGRCVKRLVRVMSVESCDAVCAMPGKREMRGKRTLVSWVGSAYVVS